jgi:hypothetical protein
MQPEPSAPSSPPLPATKPLFFAVGILKMAVLSATTLGAYELYWIYKNWQLVKERELPGIMPFWRAFFGFFWIYPLLSLMRTGERALPGAVESGTLKAGPLAMAWVLLTLTWRLPDPLGLISFSSFLPLLLVQSHVNRLNAAAAPGHDPNTRFTWANWIWVVLGGILTVLSIIGFLTPDQPTHSP